MGNLSGNARDFHYKHFTLWGIYVLEYLRPTPLLEVHSNSEIDGPSDSSADDSNETLRNASRHYKRGAPIFAKLEKISYSSLHQKKLY